jgi:hypothetical protein
MSWLLSLKGARTKIVRGTGRKRTWLQTPSASKQTRRKNRGGSPPREQEPGPECQHRIESRHLEREPAFELKEGSGDQSEHASAAVHGSKKRRTNRK